MSLVTSSSQRVVVNPVTAAVTIIQAGPMGPPGPPGLSGEESITVHILDPSPHPAYDDMQSLSSWFANQLA